MEFLEDSLEMERLVMEVDLAGADHMDGIILCNAIVV